MEAAERFSFRREDGSWTKPTLLHDYGPLYDIAGGYETLVQGVLECRSPRFLAEMLRSVVGRSLRGRRVLDIGAGNGVSGEELWRVGARDLVGVDREPAAARAAQRDRPGLYKSYFASIEDALPLLRTGRLDTLTSVGALGSNHVPTDVFANTWASFEPGAYFAVTVPPSHVEFLDMLGSPELQRHTELLRKAEFRHRLTMSGQPVHYLAIVGRKQA